MASFISWVDYDDDIFFLIFFLFFFYVKTQSFIFDPAWLMIYSYNVNLIHVLHYITCFFYISWIFEQIFSYIKIYNLIVI